MIQDEDYWSEEPEEEEEQPATPLQPRAYQIEMFEQSMEQNIIATVTGTTNGIIVDKC
jgi:hypothetical protein